MKTKAGRKAVTMYENIEIMKRKIKKQKAGINVLSTALCGLTLVQDTLQYYDSSGSLMNVEPA